MRVSDIFQYWFSGSSSFGSAVSKRCTASGTGHTTIPVSTPDKLHLPVAIGIKPPLGEDWQPEFGWHGERKKKPLPPPPPDLGTPAIAGQSQGHGFAKMRRMQAKGEGTHDTIQLEDEELLMWA